MQSELSLSVNQNIVAKACYFLSLSSFWTQSSSKGAKPLCPDKQTDFSPRDGFNGLGSTMLFIVQFSDWGGQGRTSPGRTCPTTSCPVCQGSTHFSWGIWPMLCPDNIQAVAFACFFFSHKYNTLNSFIHLDKLPIRHFYIKDTKAESAKTCHRAEYITGRIEFFPSISSFPFSPSVFSLAFAIENHLYLR